MLVITYILSHSEAKNLLSELAFKINKTQLRDLFSIKKSVLSMLSDWYAVWSHSETVLEAEFLAVEFLAD